MRWTRYVAARLRGLLRADSIRDEIDEEMRFHIDLEVEENLRRGMSPEDARRDAERRFGHVADLGERGYDVRGGRWLDALWRDLRFGVRQLVTRPAFAISAVATLALAVGATTAVFTVVDGVLLRPLPYRDPSSLDLVTQQNSPTNHFGISMADFLGIREFYKEGDAALLRTREATLTGGETPEVVRATYASAGLFDVLGVRAALGRTFEVGEDKPGAERVALISNGLWKRRYAANPGVIGTPIALDGESYTVVGVLPADFASPLGGPADVWPVMSLDPPTRRGPFYMRVIVRRAPGVSLERSNAALAAAARSLYPRWAASFSDEKATYVARPLAETVVGDVGPTLWLLLAAVAFVFLIASVNVSNLLLARAAARREEIAMRAALGASGLRLVRQFVAEGALLAVAGGVAGLALAEWAVRVLVALAPDSIPRLDQVRFDWRVLAFSAACVALCTVVLSVVPAMHAVSRGLAGSIRTGRSGSESPARRRLRDALVVAEIALALPLLAGAGLMINSFVRLNGVAPGIDPHGVVRARLSLPALRYQKPEESIRFADELLRRTSALPGVRSAALTTNLPLDGWDDSNNFDLERHPTPVGDSQPVAEYMQVTPDYLSTMGIPLLGGRGIEATDVDGTPLVAVVSQSFVRRHFPSEDPIGMRLRSGGCTDCEPTTIVGVVGDVKDHGLDGDADFPAMYVPFSQEPSSGFNLVVRTDGAPEPLVSALRGEIRAVDSDIALAEVDTMDQVVTTSTGQARYRMTLLGSFAAAALLLAAIGIYGVTAFAVGRRTREIGIRVALGANRAEVVRLVLAQGMLPSLVGIALGVAASLGLARFVASMLYGVSGTDPATFAAVVGVLVGVSLLACYVPARRALDVDPVDALRSE